MSLHMLMIDTTEGHALLSLQTSLQSVGSLLALHNQPLRDGQYGFCAVTHTGKGVTLQMLLRPQPFDLRQWHFALEKLPRMSEVAAADHAKTAKAMRSLVEFIATDKALAGLSKNLTIYGQAFSSIDAFASVLQYAAERCIQINFVAIAASWLDGQPATTEMDLASFVSGLTDFESASAVYCPCDPFAIHQACLQWAHSVLNLHPVTVSLHFPSIISQSAAPPAHAQPSTEAPHSVQLHTQQGNSQQPLPDQTPALDKPQHKPIVCRVVSEVAHLSSMLTHPLVCACHGKLVQQPPADAMRRSQTTCPVSGHTLTPAQLKRNDSMVQVGHSGVLMLPSSQAAALKPPGTLPCSGKEACPEATPLTIIKRLKMESVSESLLFGWPHILVPHADSFDSMTEMKANEQSLLALCQVLEGQHEVLLLTGCTDLDTMTSSTWPLHYVARPAGNGSMLVRRVATGEELLPVNHLLLGHDSEVPSHVREPLQDALQSVPLSDYSPLDHYCGSLNKLAGLVSQSLLRSSTPPHARPTSAPGQTASLVPDRQATPPAPLKQKAAPDQVYQPAVTKVAAPQAQQATTKATVQLSPAPSFTFVNRKPLQTSQQIMQHGKLSGNGPRPVPRPTHVQAQSQLAMAKQSEPAEQQRQGTQVKAKTAPNEAQAGPRLNFKRIRTLK